MSASDQPPVGQQDPPLSRITGAGPGPYHHVPMPEAEVGGAGRPWWERLVLGVIGVVMAVHLARM